VKLPEGISEQDFLDATERVLGLLAQKFRFGYHASEDIKQQGFLFAVKAMNKGKYDPSRPLENFLYIYLRNQFINYKRDNYFRNDPPCTSCIFHDAKRRKCMAFDSKAECEKLQNWEKMNVIKRSLMTPLDVEGISDGALQKGRDVSLDVELTELELLIDSELPMHLRADYLRLKSQQPVPKLRKQQVRAAIMEILDKYEGVEDAAEL